MSSEKQLVLVTGGASGIGAAAVVALNEDGFAPIVADIAPGVANPVAIVWPAAFDVSDEACVSREVAAIEAQHGPIYGLVNAAGILGRMHPPERIQMKNW